MSVAIPYQIYESLSDAIRYHAVLSDTHARRIADEIQYMIVYAANKALDQANAYTDTAESTIRTDMDNSLNYLSDWTSRAIDQATQPLAQDMQTILNALAEGHGTASAGIEDDLVTIGDIISQGIDTVNGALSNIVSGIASPITAAAETIYSHLASHLVDLSDRVLSIEGRIFETPARLVEQIRDVILPAEQAAAPVTLSRALDESTLDNHLISLSGWMAEHFGTLLEFTEDEVTEWAEKARDIFWAVLNPMLRPEYRRE